MARARNIKPSFFMNEDIVELSVEARLLFIGLWTLADREGRLENRPKKIKMSLFPADEINVSEQLSNISKYGFIELYNIDDTDVIQIANFIKHQNPHGLEKDSELPDVNGLYTVYDRNPKNKTVIGKPKLVKKSELTDFYNKTGAFNPIITTNNGFIDTNTEIKNSDANNNEQGNNCSETVFISDQNALNPESFNLNPDSLNPELGAQTQTVVENSWSPNPEILLSVIRQSMGVQAEQVIAMPDYDFHLGNFNAHWENKIDLTENQKTRKFAQWLILEFKKPQRNTTPNNKQNNLNVNAAHGQVKQYATCADDVDTGDSL
ncbi:hypothetical protein NDN13_01250 [Acinetobacter sp. C32I]|uniref:hypothetical protein n=1 Tax=Acinetobacter sp. C32I TaxID=2950074 RepID=UPI00203744E9|nr:hypothetical protein [Acinetobacter sp. C32I]USA53847.1 hypothetical protein NDN13_01250 [Acinetobacter sp. C32I]